MPSEPWANLLVIDDRSQQLRTIKSILSELGQNLAIATCDREASAYLSALDFAVILLRLQMPEMEQIMGEIRQKPILHDTPVIFLVESEFRGTALEKSYGFGTVDYLFEPIVPCVLKAKVAGYLSLYEKTRQVEHLSAQLQAAQQQWQEEVNRRWQAEATLQEVQVQMERGAIRSKAVNREVQAYLAEIALMGEELNQQNTQLEEAHVLLEGERQRYQDLFEFAPDGYLVTDVLGNVEEANEAMVTLLGIDRNQFVGRSLSQFILTSEQGVFRDRFRQLLESSHNDLPSGETQTFELTLQPQHGKPFPAEIVVKVVRETRERSMSLRWSIRDISERKLVEEELRHSEKRLRVALKHSPIVAFEQDAELCYTWMYPTSNASQKVLGKLDTELLGAEDAQRLTAIKRQVLTTGVGTRQEVFITFRDKVRYFDLTIEPLHNRRGDIVGITCAAADITEMRLREQQLRAIFEGTLDAIAIADDQGRYVEANPAACQLFGLPLSEFLGKRITDFIMSDFDFAEAWQAFLANGQGTGEIRLRRPDGTVRDVEWAAKANFLPGRHLSALRDITERRQAEAALRNSQRLLQKIADTTPTLLYIYELPQVHNIYINRYGADFFDCPPEEIQARGQQFFVDRLAPESVGKISELQERFASAKDGEILEAEFLMRNAKGEWRWLHAWEIIFTRNAEDIPEQILGTAIDITEQRNARDVHHALAAEQELRKRQLRFFSTVSHEFRTPLTSIIGVAELLESHALDWPDEKIARNVQRLKKAARHLHQLLDVLLTINRAESGKLDVHPSPIALAKFCRSLIRECQLTADTKHRVTFSSQGQCQNAVMDEKLLYFILTNLLSNAVKYSPDRSPVQVTLTCNPSEAIFCIQDSGIGIPEADQQHLFELFHRGRNSEEIPGTGLGLSVVKTCLDLQGGTIAIESEVGVGTTVTVTLPLVAGELG